MSDNTSPQPAVEKKSIFSSVTIWGLFSLVTTLFGIPIVQGDFEKLDTKTLIGGIIASVLVAWGRYRKGDLKIA